MERRSLEQLRLDRRLIRRRGWIAPKELEGELEQLPDTSHKVARDEESDDASETSTAD